jgi:hypothetical protein
MERSGIRERRNGSNADPGFRCRSIQATLAAFVEVIPNNGASPTRPECRLSRHSGQRMRTMRSILRRWQIESGMINKLPGNWQGKMMLASELDVPFYGLPYLGSNEVILLAKNGAELDRRIREELERRRQRMSYWIGLIRFLSRQMRTLLCPTSAF